MYQRYLRRRNPGSREGRDLFRTVCKHCGKYFCNCAQLGSFHSSDLTSDPRARRCDCGQLLWPGEICRCKLPQRRLRNPSELCPHCRGRGLVFSGICSFCNGEGRTERKSWIKKHRRCNPCVSCALALAMLRRRNPHQAINFN